MTSPTSPSSPLSPEQQHALAEANQRAKKILSAANVAAFNGWTLAVLAGVTVLFAVLSPTALIMGAAMGYLAWNELQGRDLLRRFDPEGPRRLGRNQLGVMALIVGYCLWSIYRATTNPMTELEALEEIAGPLTELVTQLTVIVYAVVGVVSVLILGLTARYYLAREKMVRAYIDETPGWIVDLQRSTL